jgi:predicted dehydrogenase
MAIVGCGAIAEHGHLPGAMLAPHIQVTALVDRNRKRAELLAERFKIAQVLEDIDRIHELADCVVVATPPGSHRSLAVDLARQGLHVLVEKPMAPTTADCDAMIEASERSGTVLAVGMARRFYPADLYIKDLLDREIMGRVRSFRFEDGYPFAWPLASNFILSKEQAGGGVLMGLGSHILDTVVWWFGDPVSCEYFTDAMGGMESECLVNLEFSSGMTGTVELSRSRQLNNQYSIQCEKGLTEAPFFAQTVRLAINDSDAVLQGSVVRSGGTSGGDWSPAQAMEAQLEDFAAAICGERPVRAPARDVRRSICIIENCYSIGRPLPAPWRRRIEIPT